MSDVESYDAQLTALTACLSHKNTGISISFAAAAVFLFEIFLTFGSEIRHIWMPRRITLTSVFFVVSRYTCLLSTVLVMKPSLQSDSSVFNSITSFSRFISIVASEFILAARTWAIWEKRRSIGWLLVGLAVSHGIPCVIIVVLDVISSTVADLPIPQVYTNRGFRCSIVVSKVAYAFITPYLLAISFESINLSLSLYKIVKWRKEMPSNRQLPLVDNIRRDGLFYYFWLLSLSIMNIGFVVQRDSPQLRQGGAQLQAALHSLLATRIVLHMASSKDMFTTPMSTTIATGSDTLTEPQFTSVMMTRDIYTDIEQDAHTPEPQDIPLQPILRRNAERKNRSVHENV